MLTRRFFLASAGSALTLPRLTRAQTARYPFTLGVASGCPRPDGLVLWTRLAPVPLAGGGMPPGPVEVRYRLCRDEAMRRTVREGLVGTSEMKGHSVHVPVTGLEPGREYFYQFYFGEDESPVGRTRTADPRAAGVKLALANCQSYQTGHYAAYRDLAEWAPDCVIHVGDYIYEGAAGPLGRRRVEYPSGVVEYQVVRQHDGPETVTLWDYRNRYALYRSDPHLQAAHAAAPWIVAMDDHEIDNNWAADTPQDPEKQTPLEFAVRKLAALQAYYEHMPLERPPLINCLAGHLQMYGSYRLGPAQVNLLDTRQYRSDQVCGSGFPGVEPCAALDDPSRTMTGAAQERWLLARLRRSQASFNVVASQTWFAPFQYVGADTPRWNMDQWDGYPLQRQRLLEALAQVANPVVLSGDWHCAAAMTLHRDPTDATSPRVGHNFAATSISSVCSWYPRVHESQAANPHVHYVEGRKRGYLRCEVAGGVWTSSYRVVRDPRDPASPVSTDREIRTDEL
jgi:alkaline phosphatase D